MTAPSACPYLSGKFERKVFTHLTGPSAAPLNDALSLVGFRRSQNIAYRPACEECSACVSVRVLVDEFKPGKSFKRVVRQNDDLVAREVDALATAEQYEVFNSYIEARHHDGGMADMTSYDYVMMIEESQVDSYIVEYRQNIPGRPDDSMGGELIAAVLIDRLQNGLSMIYSFFQPQHTQRSLGSYLILDTIARAKALNLDYVYLGYWVEGSDKMAYKARFSPQEMLVGNIWRKSDLT